MSTVLPVLSEDAPSKGQSRKWVFTLNNYTAEELSFIETIKPRDQDATSKVQCLAFAKEVAPTTGTPHLQGVIHCARAESRTAVKKILNTQRVYLAPQRGDNLQAINAYLNKQAPATIKGTPVEQGQRSDYASLHADIKSGKFSLDEIADKHVAFWYRHKRFIQEEYEKYNRLHGSPVPLRLENWQTWMTAELIKPPVTRCIYWIWSAESATGKSTFKKYCASKMTLLDVNTAKMDDILYAYTGQQVIWINLPRHVPDSLLTTYMNVLERLSDGGIQASNKYESKQKKVKAHIVVTANIPPPHDLLPKRFVEVKASLTERPDEDPPLPTFQPLASPRRPTAPFQGHSTNEGSVDDLLEDLLAGPPTLVVRDRSSDTHVEATPPSRFKPKARRPTDILT